MDYDSFIETIIADCEKGRDEEGLEWSLLRFLHANPDTGEEREFRHTVRVTGMRHHTFGITSGDDDVPYSDCPCKPLYSVSEDDVTVIHHQPMISVVE